jgi:hypothetical protein
MAPKQLSLKSHAITTQLFIYSLSLQQQHSFIKKRELIFQSLTFQLSEVGRHSQAK